MNKLYSVHDHWTDINKKNDVDIESIDGVITGIKVNGEDYSGGGGSSDFSMANVKVIKNTSNVFLLTMPNIFDNKLHSYMDSEEFESGDVIQVALYKGSVNNISASGNSSFKITGEGNVIKSPRGFVIGITGDCTITVSNAA